MSRIRIVGLIAVLACLTAGPAAVAAARTAPQAANHNVTLSVKKTGIGDILVQNGGLIVYMFTHDKHGQNTCPASNGCASVWPPIVGTPKLGAGVKKSLIGRVKVGNEYQVTYGGYPLYGYDENSTSDSYVSIVQFGGAWNALSPSGKQVKNKQ